MGEADRAWPSFVVRSGAVPETTSAYPAPFDGVLLGAGRDLGRAAGSRSLGAWRDRLAPGARSSFTHAHLREEEAVYVLSGRPTLRWIPPGGDAAEVELAPGDYASFPAGTGIAHALDNRTEHDVELLVVGERRTGERVTYPDDPAFEAWRTEHRPHRAWPDVERPQGDAVWPAWRVETERVVLRPWTVDDVVDLRHLTATEQAHLAPYMPWARTVPTTDELLERVLGFVRNFVTNEDYVYGIFLPDGAPIGGCGLHRRFPGGYEIGYWIRRDQQGKGLVTGAAAALTRVAFEGKSLAVEIHCDPKNTRSAAIPARLGFRHAATLPARLTDVHGRPRDTMVWSMAREDHAGSAAAAVPCVARDALGRRIV